jgi:Flp pilus assembly protein TadG
MRNRRGNYSIITALSLTALIGLAALAVDFSRIYMARGQIQGNVDAAALSAMVVYRSEIGDLDVTVEEAREDAQAAAEWIMAQNLVAEQRGEVEVEFEMGSWDWDDPGADDAFDPDGDALNALEVVARRVNGAETSSVNTLLAPLMGGPDHVDVGAKAVGAFRSREVVVVYDATRSLNVGEIANEKDAVVEFLASMKDIGTPGDKIGLVTFTGDAELVTALTPITESADFEDTWTALKNCEVNADHYAGSHWTHAGYANYTEWVYGADDIDNIFPYSWPHTKQRGNGFNFRQMAFGSDNRFTDPPDSPAEAKFIARNTVGGINNAYNSGLLPCNAGRDPGEYYGRNGKFDDEYPYTHELYLQHDRHWRATGYLRPNNNWRSFARTQVPVERYYDDTGTNQEAALRLAWDTLLDSTDDSALKVIVLFSDGLPEPGVSADWLEGSLWLEDQAMDAAVEICETGVSLFTISYNQSIQSRQTEFLHDMSENIYRAEDEEDYVRCNFGRFEETNDASQLSAIARDIAGDIPIAIVR